MIKRKSDFHIYIEYRTQTSGINRVDIIDCVNKYRLECGPENPIRYMELSINRSSIVERFPGLMDAVVEGETRIIIDAVGYATMVITKLWLEEHTYEIVASGIEVNLNTSMLTSHKIKLPAKSIIEEIFASWKNSMRWDKQIDMIIHQSRETYNTPSLTIMSGLSMSLVMQLCSLVDNSFIFFADIYDEESGKYKECMYYADYNDIAPVFPDVIHPDKNGEINIYPDLKDYNIEYTDYDILMNQRISDITSKDSEASSTIINTQSLTYTPFQTNQQGEIVFFDPLTITSDKGVYGSEYYTGARKSIGCYGEYKGMPLDMADYLGYDMEVYYTPYRILINNIVRRYKDPSQSITFTVSESIKDEDGELGWERMFEPFSYANRINDEVHKVYLTNEHYCDKIKDPSVLRLSTYIHNYPELTTTYTFGIQKESGLAQALADMTQKKQ